jgi:hypothetical protein
MPLVLRRAQLQRRRGGTWSEEDYDIVSGELVIGRLYKGEVAGNENVWKWRLSAISGSAAVVKFSGTEVDLEQAKEAISKNWRAWLELAALTEKVTPAVVRIVGNLTLPLSCAPAA